MNIRYVNSRGIEVNLNKEPYKLLVSDLLNHDWGIVEKSQRIVGFRKATTKRSVSIDIIKSSGKSSRRLMNDLTDVFEYDVINATPGRLYIDDNYLKCFLCSGEKENWETDVIISCEYGLVTDMPFWIQDRHFSFGISPGMMAAQNNLDYPHDYPYDYTAAGENSYIENDHYGACDFEMHIFGPVTNPSILINNHLYEVTVRLEQGEYLQIRSREGTVYKVSESGEKTNLYNYRNKDSSVFERIPPGSNLVSWDGNFGFDITLYVERSEPQWIL